MEAAGRRALAASAPAPTPTPLLLEGQPSEGGMLRPFPSCPALQCGAPCLSDRSQGEWGPGMRERL